MLEVTDLHAGYQTAAVLSGVTLRVDEGETVGLLGRNGMGKSTLVRSVCGLTPPSITGGTVTFDGRALMGRTSYAIARLGIGLVPQGRRIFGSLTVHENLSVVARGGGRWDTDAVYELFPRLAERRGQFAGTLSGGEQQMLAIGRALMTNPRLLIMDEPSEGLAPAVLELIVERLRQLRDTGQSVLFVEQNLEMAFDLADRIALLGDGGTVAWHGSADELRGAPDVVARHLGI